MSFLLESAVAVLAIVLIYNLLIAYAISQGRIVKTGLKIPFATFFFEADDPNGSIRPNTTLHEKPIARKFGHKQ